MTESKPPSPAPNLPTRPRRVVITGCNRGIGRGLAEAFVAAGWDVVAHARTAHAARVTAAEVGAKAWAAGELGDRALGARLAAAVRDLDADGQGGAGGLDLLVLSAAVLGPKGPLAATDLTAFEEVMRLNVDAQLAIFQALLPALLSARGTVIWISSGLGRFVLPNYGAYCISKHALEALSKLAHAEYAERGLISVTVSPGMVQTEMLKAATENPDVSQYTPPAVMAASFLRLVAALGPEHSGRALESSDF